MESAQSKWNRKRVVGLAICLAVVALAIGVPRYRWWRGAVPPTRPCALALPDGVAPGDQAAVDQFLASHFNALLSDPKDPNWSMSPEHDPGLSLKQLVRLARKRGFASKFLNQDQRNAMRIMFLRNFQDSMATNLRNGVNVFSAVVDLDCLTGIGLFKGSSKLADLWRVYFEYHYKDVPGGKAWLEKNGFPTTQ